MSGGRSGVDVAADQELLEDLVERGVNPEQKRLFVIDGSKALRSAINAVFGAQHPVQRCRAHKLRNVLDHLPEEHKADVKRKLQNAYAMADYEDAKRALQKVHRELMETSAMSLVCH